MNIIPQISKFTAIRRPFGKDRQLPCSPARSATLSTSELKRAVAAMLG